MLGTSSELCQTPCFIQPQGGAEAQRQAAYSLAGCPAGPPLTQVTGDALHLLLTSHPKRLVSFSSPFISCASGHANITGHQDLGVL